MLRAWRRRVTLGWDSVIVDVEVPASLHLQRLPYRPLPRRLRRPQRGREATLGRRTLQPTTVARTRNFLIAPPVPSVATDHRSGSLPTQPPRTRGNRGRDERPPPRETAAHSCSTRGAPSGCRRYAPRGGRA